MGLTDEQITAILQSKRRGRVRDKNPPQGITRASIPYFQREIGQQVGPLRYTEKERRCASRGCGGSTHYFVQGIPRCVCHALQELNEILVSAGFRGTAVIGESRPSTSGARICSASTQYRLAVGWAPNKFECIHGINLVNNCRECEGVHGSDTTEQSTERQATSSSTV